MMMTRRDAVAAFALFAELLASARDTEAQTQTTPATPTVSPRPPVFKHDLPNVTLDDWEVTVNIVDYEPGRVGAPHRHAGFVLAYVLEGAVIAKISGQGEEKHTPLARCSTSSLARRTRSRTTPAGRSPHGCWR